MSKRNEITKVPFYGNEIVVIEKNGEKFVAMKPIIEALGLNWKSQHKLIQRDPVLSTMVVTETVASKDGFKREMTCLALDCLNGWLFKVPASRYTGKKQAAIIRYQKECYQALHDYFHKGATINPLAGAEKIVELFEKAIEKINQRDDVIRSQQKIIDSVTSDSVYGEQSEVTGLPKVVLVRQHFRSYAPCKKKKNKMQMVFDFFKGGKCNA
jgi:hypothetical protein